MVFNILNIFFFPHENIIVIFFEIFPTKNVQNVKIFMDAAHREIRFTIDFHYAYNCQQYPSSSI